jgi:hypothetical protein
MGKILSSLTILLLVTGCGHTTYSFFNDKKSNTHIVRMNGNRLAGGIRYVALDAQRYEEGGQISYSLIIRYQGPLFINIDSEKPLVIIIDGQRNELTGRGSKGHQHHVSLGVINESAYYHGIKPGFIKKLAYAKKIVVEIHGSTDILTRYFKEKNLSNLKEFYHHYVDTALSTQ